MSIYVDDLLGHLNLQMNYALKIHLVYFPEMHVFLELTELFLTNFVTNLKLMIQLKTLYCQLLLWILYGLLLEKEKFSC